jgi:probable rRNA maturation factor
MSLRDDIPLSFSSPARVRKGELRQFLAELTRGVTRGRAISCLIANDAELRRLNKTFRKQDYATDVLSFPSGGSDDSAGDVAISIDRARAQAAEHRHSLELELRILMLHGALHLAGMDHETDGGEMARAETRWRKRLHLPTGLIERNGESKVRK